MRREQWHTETGSSSTVPSVRINSIDAFENDDDDGARVWVRGVELRVRERLTLTPDAGLCLERVANPPRPVRGPLPR